MTASLFSRSRTARAASLLIAACVLCAQPGAPLYAQEGAKPAAGGKVTLDFANAEILSGLEKGDVISTGIVETE